MGPLSTGASLKSVLVLMSLAPEGRDCWGQDGPSGDSLVPPLQNHVWEDVTLHNSSLPPLAIKNPECLGLLHRLDGSTDVWMQHYCILKDGCLYFYASIRSTQASGTE